MAGRIRASDIEDVRSRTDIAEIIGEQVALKPAGVGALKGLCPFHDERSPSFHVRRQVGRYHCFGCGEGGDVFSFLMAIDHVTFVEAVERLASRLNYQLTYEDGAPQQDTANRVRLLEANRIAGEFYVEQLTTPAAELGRRFLGERGFDRDAAATFGVGWAPNSYDALRDHLRGRGFQDAEIAAAGLASSGDRGIYDRFRGRVVWPIRDLTGATVGFGARRLREDDQGPKYLNTPDTPIYHKSQVLYGIDLAKRDMSRQKRVVVVEGYTDVMACHLSGVTTAVATCGTAFGVDHIKVLRRVLGDDSVGGEVVFTFDPDAAGQKAAVRAFAEERRFTAQTFVAVGANGLDPNDLRIQQGDAAVRHMIEAKKPMFEFMLRQVLAQHDLDTVEGRVAALRGAAPIVADIRDPVVRPAYARELARWLAMDVREVERAVQTAGRAAARARIEPRQDPSRDASAEQAEVQPPRRIALKQLPHDPGTRLEREALMVIVQLPHLVGAELIHRAVEVRFGNRALAAVRDAIGSQLHRLGGAGWLERLTEQLPEPLTSLPEELALAPLPARMHDEEALAPFARDVVTSLVIRDLDRQKADLLASLQRSEGGEDASARQRIRVRLVDLETQQRRLREA